MQLSHYKLQAMEFLTDSILLICSVEKIRFYCVQRVSIRIWSIFGLDKTTVCKNKECTKYCFTVSFTRSAFLILICEERFGSQNLFLQALKEKDQCFFKHFAAQRRKSCSTRCFSGLTRFLSIIFKHFRGELKILSFLPNLKKTLKKTGTKLIGSVTECNVLEHAFYMLSQVSKS